MGDRAHFGNIIFFVIFFVPPRRNWKEKNLRVKNYFHNFFLISKSLRRRGLNSKQVKKNQVKKNPSPWLKEILEFDFSRWPQNDGNLVYLL